MWILIYFLIMFFVYLATVIYFFKKVAQKKEVLKIEMIDKLQITQIKYFLGYELIEEKYLSNNIMLDYIKKNYSKASREIFEMFKIKESEFEILEKKASDYKINMLLIYGTLMTLNLAYFFQNKERNLFFFIVHLIVCTSNLIVQIKFSKTQKNDIENTKQLIYNSVKKIDSDLKEIIMLANKKDINNLIKCLKNNQ